MAKLTRAEREEQQRISSLAHAYGTLRADVEKFASRRVLSATEAYRDDEIGKQFGHLLAVANEIAYKREHLQKDMQYLADRMLDDIKRLGKGRESDDITRNSAFANIGQDIALFNYRLQRISAKCEDAGIIVVELHPHLTKLQLQDIINKALTLIDSMNGIDITEQNVAQMREEFISIQRMLWR